MLNLKEADVTQTRFYQEVFQIGQQKGQQIGGKIGRKDGEIKIVLRLLKRRCGKLSIAQQQKVRSLSITQIETLAEALLDFKGTGDLEIWLRENLG
jgi:predicted transposase YdaD